jgi:hypothetical protein
LTASTPRRAFVGLPNNWDIEPEAYEAAHGCVAGRSDIHAYVWRSENSLLPHNFNICLARCLNEGGYDYFALLHSDIGLGRGWLGVMIDELESHGLDALHAVVPIKNGSGLTSTAVAYDDDEWGLERRITLKELANLPKTFDIEVLQDCYDKRAIRLLPNTGVLVLKNGDWLRQFPGFSNPCKMIKAGDAKWQPITVPEDWNFGHWAARNGVKVGGTKAVVTRHAGRHTFRSDGDWGFDRDPDWEQGVKT